MILSEETLNKCIEISNLFTQDSKRCFQYLKDNNLDYHDLDAFRNIVMADILYIEDEDFTNQYNEHIKNSFSIIPPMPEDTIISIDVLDEINTLNKDHCSVMTDDALNSIKEAVLTGMKFQLRYVYNALILIQQELTV